MKNLAFAGALSLALASSATAQQTTIAPPRQQGAMSQVEQIARLNAVVNDCIRQRNIFANDSLDKSSNAAAERSNLESEIAALQKEIADLKAKYEPAQKPEAKAGE
jgi:Skp family chaperone for outer membrane proteins